MTIGPNGPHIDPSLVLKIPIAVTALNPTVYNVRWASSTFNASLTIIVCVVLKPAVLQESMPIVSCIGSDDDNSLLTSDINYIPVVIYW